MLNIVMEVLLGLLIFVIVFDTFFGNSTIIITVNEFIQLKVNAIRLSNEMKKVEIEERKANLKEDKSS